MAALLEELRRPRLLRQRLLWVAAVALVLAGGAIAGSAAGLFAPAQGPCAHAGAGAGGVWNPARRSALERAFAASGALDAAPQWGAFARAVDGYTAAWSAMRVDSCEATHVRGEQSPQLLARRTGCLDRRLDELRALLDLDGAADAAAVAHATAAGAGLGSLDLCANAAALAEQQASAPRARGALVRELARARALKLAGRWPVASSAARALAARARAVPDRAIEAAALVIAAAAERGLGRWKEAEEAAYQAIEAAEASRSGETAVEAWLELIRALGVDGNRREETRRMTRLAAAAIQRHRRQRPPAGRAGGAGRRPGHGARRPGRGAPAPGARGRPARAARRAGLRTAAIPPGAARRAGREPGPLRRGAGARPAGTLRRPGAAGRRYTRPAPCHRGRGGLPAPDGPAEQALVLFEHGRALGERLGAPPLDMASLLEGIARVHID